MRVIDRCLLYAVVVYLGLTIWEGVNVTEQVTYLRDRVTSLTNTVGNLRYEISTFKNKGKGP